MESEGNWIKSNKDYLSGLGLIILIGVFVQILKLQDENLSIFYQIPLAILAFTFIIGLVSGLIFLITWPFYRNLRLIRFLKISVVIGIIFDISSIATLGMR